MRKVILCMLAVLFLALMPASAEMYSIEAINSLTSDRVHLREKPDGDSKSLGLYFTGTPVVVLSDENEAWIPVLIGTERGYVHHTLLTDHAVTKNSRLANINAKGTLNLRAHPDKEAAIVARLPEDHDVEVLGETHDRWSFIRYNNLYGYVMSSYLDTDGYWPYESKAIPSILQDSYSICGTGAWHLSATVFRDGTIWGYYHDSDMGTTHKRYPNGTVYECIFAGKLKHIQQVSEYEYTMTIGSYHHMGTANEERILNRTRYVTLDSAGFRLANHCSIYLPGYPVSQLPDGIGIYLSDEQYLTKKVWFNHSTQSVLIAE